MIPRADRAAAMPFIMLTTLIDMVSIGLIIPVLPALVGSFTGSQADQAFWYGVVTFAFGLANFFASPILGALSDAHGRRPVLLLGFCGLALSFLATALATALWMLIAVRLVSGAMQANMSVANAYVADITPPEAARQALRHARGDVRPGLHPRAGDGRPAGRDRPAPAVLRRRQPRAAQPALRLFRAARVAAGGAPARVSTGRRRIPSPRCAAWRS